MINSSRDEAASAREWGPGAAAYATAPVGFRELARIVQSIPGLWLTIGTGGPDVSEPDPSGPR